MLKRLQREEEILLSLKKLDYLSRSQIQTLHRLGQERNARRVMQELKDYVSSFKDGENVFYLNAKGRERVNCTKVRKRSDKARHAVMRNYLYIAYGCPATWKNEVKFTLQGIVSVTCDAYFMQDRRYHIIEVDNTQTMAENRKKINSYRKLIENNAFELQPQFIWLTKTPYRKKQLEKLMADFKCAVFTITDFE